MHPGVALQRPAGSTAALARERAPAVVLLVPVAVAVFVDGGYGSASSTAFGATAVLALAVLLWSSGRPARLEPAVLVLAALAVLGALSALWAIGPVDRALRWALVAAGYAALAGAATVAVRRYGVGLVAGAIGALALATATTGLVATVFFEAPYALRKADVWRPAGPFEYPPALALLQVSALPALIAGMAHRSRALAAVAALGIAFAGGVIALAGSRTGLALAVVVAGFALTLPRRMTGGRRALVAGSLALAVGAGALLAAAAGAPVAPGADADPGRVAALAAVALLAAPVWLAARSWIARRPEGRPRPIRPLPATAAVLAIAVVAGSLAFGAGADRGAGPPSGFLHGRTDTWRAAAATFADRPITGTGAGGFLTGSARHQQGQTVRFAHQLPLELGVELGVAGLLLAVALYAACIAAVWKARATRAGWLAGPAVAAFLVAGLVDWPWHLAGAGAVWALALGALGGGIRAR